MYIYVCITVCSGVYINGVWVKHKEKSNCLVVTLKAKTYIPGYLRCQRVWCMDKSQRVKYLFGSYPDGKDLDPRLFKVSEGMVYG